MKRIPVNEQETTIQFNRDESTVNIWTSDSTVMTKLDKLANDSESPWECVATEVDEIGWVVCREYRCPKNLISFRSGKRKPKNSDSNHSKDN